MKDPWGTLKDPDRIPEGHEKTLKVPLRTLKDTKRTLEGP